MFVAAIEFTYYRVPRFLPSRPNWVPLPPHPQASVATQGDTLTGGGGGWGTQFRRRHRTLLFYVYYNPIRLLVLLTPPKEQNYKIHISANFDSKRIHEQWKREIDPEKKFVLKICIWGKSFNLCSISIKGTQDWEFFWLRFWNLLYFFVSYVKILRFYKKNIWLGHYWGRYDFSA
jgi:hypothetical protein